jgi:hypothetical protein
MAALLLTKDSLRFCARERSGELSVSAGNAVAWTADAVWLQVEKSSSTLTYRYSSDGNAWTTIGSIPFGHVSSKLGFFATGSPDAATVAYIENLTEITNTREVLEETHQTGFSNPSGDQVFITHPEYFTRFSIYDLKGRLHLHGTISGNYIDTQALPAGLYVLRLEGADNEKPLTGKLLIAR